MRISDWSSDVCSSDLPVGGFARIIGAAERRWNREAWSGRVRRWTGFALLLLLLGVGAGVGLALEWAIRRWGGGTAWPWLALAAWPALAQNSLYVHVAPVVRALTKGEMDAARDRKSTRLNSSH